MAWVSGAIAAAGALGGGLLGSKGADSASKAQQKAMREQLAFQKWLYEQQVGRSEPWRATGQGALNSLARLYGLPYMPYSAPNFSGGYGLPGGDGLKTVGNNNLAKKLGFGAFGSDGSRTAKFGQDNLLTAKNVIKMLKQGRTVDEISKAGILETSLNPRRLKKLYKHGLDADEISMLQKGPEPEGGLPDVVTPTGPDMSVFTTSPDYQFRRDEGMRGIENSAAARGGAFSGNALRALNDFNSNLASGEFGNYFNRMASLAGIGQTAVGQQQQAGNYFGGYGGNAIGNMGDARASGIANSANIWGNAIGGAANAFGNWWGNRQPTGQQAYDNYQYYGSQGWGG